MNEAPARVSVELEVPFHDVDSMQIVWHGHYLKYFEIGRTALMRSRQLETKDITTYGYQLVVIESKCRHVYPLRYGDRFRVDSWFKDFDVRINVAYEITNLTAERRTAKGHTMLATLDAEGKMLLGTPDVLLRHILS
jgi:acyl-CoA thioester hydrolase